LFKVSVIIPVYNTEKYIIEAIQSVASLEDVGEILVVDDGSTDNSLSICKDLATNIPLLRILQHKDSKNHGRSASRNLGIKSAKYPYVSFLDADDIYLSNRFEIDKSIFEKNQDIDGVYGALKAFFETNSAKSLFFEHYSSDLTTIKTTVSPENLLEILLFGSLGHFQTNTITLKKSIFKKIGLFRENLFLGEDTHLWLRAACLGKLVPGSIIDPIALRRVHDSNSIHIKGIELTQQQDLVYETLFFWSIKQKIIFDKQNLFFIAMCSFKSSYNKGSDILILILQIFKYPLILLSTFFYRKLAQLLIK